MPELPEVETVRRGLAPVLEGAVFDRVELRRPDLRFPFPPGFAGRLEGRTVAALGRRAKYLLAGLDDGATLAMHLGMSGSFRVADSVAAADAFHHARGKDERHDHVVFALSGARLPGGARVVYNDPRRFGFMILVEPGGLERHPLFAHLGLEPVAGALDPDALAARLAGRTTSLKAALLDQTLIAGLGNIYVSEALWRAGLSPRRAAGSLVRKDGRASGRLVRLTECIVAVIADAVAAGGSSLRDYVRADGSLGMFQHAFRVYDREDGPCLRPGCRGVVRRLVQTGRSTFYCPVCQR
ncbi:bifunctional DNA-formamidopyrimidine glycosylase/DNA-(apurinic or apyrimidinic site) lyase [Propylenella binzhouense]|uniref:Formamidopyrimidine-DNA glycosylase n=1 Tax=Propylenella binzhouense TaxID=2555902 RepID=A0A964T3N5_9HYPH|nr:bifunctional DNA-formamidopyrimidine glycosylase/DNA-(apurinic or apyrimidinic site) lyase [Propylenella binzhouense]MYZ47620.1 bifunctional DNA-formamidopyrimidine glycosylase/DNA-(apurinic or apyrimidinic site) lyase [Propylenella binzhouense]